MRDMERVAGLVQEFRMDPDNVAHDDEGFLQWLSQAFAEKVADFAWGTARVGAVHIDPRDIVIERVDTPVRNQIEFRMMWNPIYGFANDGTMSAVLVDHEVNHLRISKSAWRTSVRFARLRPLNEALFLGENESIPELIPHEYVDFRLYGWHDTQREWVMTPDGKAPERSVLD